MTKVMFQSLKSFMSDNDFVQVAKEVNENVNGYPFITFYTESNKAENFYFTVKKSKDVHKGMLVTGSLLRELQIAFVTNAEGEARVKLSGFGESARLELADLL